MATVYLGTGRRKSAVARVRLVDGSGRIFVNKRDAREYFGLEKHICALSAPLVLAKADSHFDVHVSVLGGGLTGQAGAVRLGIARALAQSDPEAERLLRNEKFMTRDARVKERKKYGRRGARRGFQFSKR